MTDLKQPLDDLVREVPRHVVPDDLARSTWAAGRRRRWRRRAAVGGVAAVLLALVLPGLGPQLGLRPAPVPADTPVEGAVDGYPQRIGHQWWVQDLPDRPGPMAGVLYRESEGGPVASQPWIAVSASGRQWRIPSRQSSHANRPTLSNTGRFLGYFPHELRGPFVVHDLVTGERTPFPGVVPHMAKGAAKPAGSRRAHIQTPAFWSPDDRHLFLYAASGRFDEEILLGTDGTQRKVRSAGEALGWVGADRIAWLERAGKRGDEAATLTVTDVDGGLVSRMDLPLRRKDAGELSQWSAAASPDGSALVVVTGDFGDTTVHQFSLSTGARLAEPLSVPGVDEFCQPGWAGGTALLPSYPSDTGGRLVQTGERPPGPLVVAEPGTGAQCLVLARDAAAGEPHGLFGTATATWTWWWRELLLACVGGSALVLGLRQLRLSRARRTPGTS